MKGVKKMTYTLGNKTIRIPDTDIQELMSHHSLTKDEAIQLWLEDEGYLENEEVEDLSKKAKTNKVTATIHQAKSTEKTDKPRKPKTVKISDEKQEIFKHLVKSLADYDTTIVTENKLITIQLNGKTFKLDLVEQRQKKK